MLWQHCTPQAHAVYATGHSSWTSVCSVAYRMLCDILTVWKVRSRMYSGSTTMAFAQPHHVAVVSNSAQTLHTAHLFLTGTVHRLYRTLCTTLLLMHHQQQQRLHKQCINSTIAFSRKQVQCSTDLYAPAQPVPHKLGAGTNRCAGSATSVKPATAPRADECNTCCKICMKMNEPP